MESGHRFDAQTLHSFIQAVFRQMGSEEQEAKLVADHLIAANLAGHDSHGIGMIPSYVRSWSQGHLQINHHAKIVKEAGAAVTLDGDRAFGQVAAHEAMALGIKEVLSLETSAIEERFHLENNEGAALLFSGGICDDLPGGAFLYTNQQTLSLGIVCPLSSLTQSRVPASELLTRFKAHPAVRPLIKNTESLEYGAHLVPEGGLHSMPVQYAGNGWLLVGDALRSCVNTGISVRGMDMALTGAQAAAQTLISACQHREPQNLFPLYHHNVERSLLWDVLQRYQHVPALLQRPGWYRTWPALMQDISRDLWDQGDKPVPPLRQLFWHHLRRHGLWHLAGDVIRSLRCL